MYQTSEEQKAALSMNMPMGAAHTESQSSKQSNYEDKDMPGEHTERAIEGALLGAALTDRRDRRCDDGFSRCGETLEGLSRHLHSIDMRGDRNADRLACVIEKLAGRVDRLDDKISTRYERELEMEKAYLQQQLIACNACSTTTKS